MKLIMESNDVTRRIYSQCRAEGRSAITYDRLSSEEVSENYGVTYDDGAYVFDLKTAKPLVSEEELPKVFDDILFNTAVAIAKTRKPQDNEVRVIVEDNGDSSCRYLVTKDEINMARNNVACLPLYRDVKTEMRERAQAGEFSEDTRPYLSDEEASDMLLKEQGDYE